MSLCGAPPWSVNFFSYSFSLSSQPSKITSLKQHSRSSESKARDRKPAEFKCVFHVNPLLGSGIKADSISSTSSMLSWMIFDADANMISLSKACRRAVAETRHRIAMFSVAPSRGPLNDIVMRCKLVARSVSAKCPLSAEVDLCRFVNRAK